MKCWSSSTLLPEHYGKERRDGGRVRFISLLRVEGNCPDERLWLGSTISIHRPRNRSHVIFKWKDVQGLVDLHHGFDAMTLRLLTFFDPVCSVSFLFHVQ